MAEVPGNTSYKQHVAIRRQGPFLRTRPAPATRYIKSESINVAKQVGWAQFFSLESGTQVSFAGPTMPQLHTLTTTLGGCWILWMVCIVGQGVSRFRLKFEPICWRRPIVLSFAPSAAAVWHCDHVRIPCESNSVRHSVFS